ncbi:MAG: thioesterase family protein [Chloroflexi bacterium]|nr:thioesterase family protein [Chloroflexota bacterium]
MTEKISVGLSNEVERLVTHDTTAHVFGNTGVEVFATPALIALLEETAIGCIAAYLEEGQTSVGTHVDVRHLAATPLGMKVIARAELVEVEGRKLVFRVEARDEREQIASGTHERFIIQSLAKFLARAAAKIHG